MSSSTMEAYYRDNFGSKRHLQGQIVNARTNAVALQYLLNLKEIRSWLDVGTGYGLLLKWLKERGIRAEGIELSNQEADYARGELGLDVRSRLLSEANLPLASFDVVSCFEVIEHVSEPIAFLKELAGYVRPGGYLVVMTDNFESTAVRKLKGSFPKWIPHTHISHFGPESLRKCMTSLSGITIAKEASYTPWDVVGRQYLTAMRPPVSDERAYDVRAALSTEMHRNYKLYQLRYMLNPVWTRMNLRRSLDGGALMYAVARKRA
ncbi:MAG TPA: class I SAM-dependent methyltransferase [Silvibacterium sp.]|nr:class I SAM-dependent methyltransferase [Silvibacterium sp.]